MHWCPFLFIKTHWMSPYSMPGTVTDTSVAKTNHHPSSLPPRAYSQVERKRLDAVTPSCKSVSNSGSLRIQRRK